MITNEIEFGLDTPGFVTVDQSGHGLSGAVVTATPSRKPLWPMPPVGALGGSVAHAQDHQCLGHGRHINECAVLLAGLDDVAWVNGRRDVSPQHVGTIAGGFGKLAARILKLSTFPNS